MGETERSLKKTNLRMFEHSTVNKKIIKNQQRNRGKKDYFACRVGELLGKKWIRTPPQIKNHN